MKLDLTPIRDNARKLYKSIGRFPDKPSPQAVHRLRTRIRRFEAGFEALTLPPEKKRTRLITRLHSIESRAGKLRDLDVFTARLAALHPPEDDKCLVELLLYIGAKRDRLAARLSGKVEKQAGMLRRKIKKVLRQFEKHVGKSMRIPDEDTWRQVNASRLEHFFEVIRSTTLDQRNLHNYRIAIKELQDLILVARPAPDAEFVKSLEQSKNAIGEWHDWIELVALSRKVLKDHRGCKLQAMFKTMARKKFQTALRTTNKMRAHYLKMNNSGLVISG